MITLIIPSNPGCSLPHPLPCLEQHNCLCTNTGDLMREQIRNGIAVSRSRLLFLLCRDTSFSCRIHRTRRYQVGTEYFKTDTGVRSPRWDRNGRAALNWHYLILAEQCKGNSHSINPCAEARKKSYSEGFGGALATCIHWPLQRVNSLAFPQPSSSLEGKKLAVKCSTVPVQDNSRQSIHEVSWDLITIEVSLTSTVVFGCCFGFWCLFVVVFNYLFPLRSIYLPTGALGIPTVRRQFVLHWESCKQHSCKFQSVHRS